MGISVYIYIYIYNIYYRCIGCQNFEIRGCGCICEYLCMKIRGSRCTCKYQRMEIRGCECRCEYPCKKIHGCEYYKYHELLINIICILLLLQNTESVLSLQVYNFQCYISVLQQQLLL